MADYPVEISLTATTIIYDFDRDRLDGTTWTDGLGRK